MLAFTVQNYGFLLKRGETATGADLAAKIREAYNPTNPKTAAAVECLEKNPCIITRTLDAGYHVRTCEQSELQELQETPQEPRGPLKFSELPDAQRFSIIRQIYELNGTTAGYHADGGVTIAMPRDPAAQSMIRAILEAAGFTRTQEAFFPLGSDNPPAEQRHFGPYSQERPGYWLYTQFKPKQDQETKGA